MSKHTLIVLMSLLLEITVFSTILLGAWSRTHLFSAKKDIFARFLAKKKKKWKSYSLNSGLSKWIYPHSKCNQIVVDIQVQRFEVKTAWSFLYFKPGIGMSYVYLWPTREKDRKKRHSHTVSSDSEATIRILMAKIWNFQFLIK